jgi:excinuclease ABC subunit A
MGGGYISIKGAREHNLKNISLDIPRDKMVVITGISGSGKSSLAFDTIYAEGQRRYVESLSAYARQFLEQMQKPDVEHIEGLPPTIAIQQRVGLATPRSTVATTTEIYDYLRVLFARAGTPHCYKCRKPITQQSAQQIIERIMTLPPGSKLTILAPVVRGRKGAHKDVFERIRREGFVRVRVDGTLIEAAKLKPLDGKRKHNVEIVVDRLVMSPEIKTRLSDSIETALKLGEGIVIVSSEAAGKTQDELYSELYACPDCGVSFDELSPRMFSFNSPYGACQKCDGLGTRMEFDVDLVVPDPKLSLSDGAIDAWRHLGQRMSIYYYGLIREFAHEFDVDMDTPFDKLSEEKRNILLHGTTPEQQKKLGGAFEGVIPHLQKRFENTSSDFIKHRILDYMSELPCTACGGSRLRQESLAVRVDDRNIDEVVRMSVEQALRFLATLTLSGEKRIIVSQVIREITQRLQFLADVGLSYLTLDRRSATLAGGEAQRIRLASQVGSGLVGVCYVLDEPTIGLHARDTGRLLTTLLRLRDLGNTVIVVEHDEETIRASDYVVDIGPGAGAHGGHIIAKGTVPELLLEKNSLTAKYMSGEMEISVPVRRRHADPENFLEVRGAREHNLKDITVRIPLGCFCCVTGVSGSGKSTLVEDIICRGLMRKLYGGRTRPGAHDKMIGSDNLDKVIVIEQSPIGRTPRSNPSTYTGVFDEIRKLFAMTKEAKLRGYGGGRFSFNVRGGRCESCEGQGTKIIGMHFLPDVYVVCEACKGKRYNRETLEITFKGRSIADVLEMSVEEAMDFFRNFPKILRPLKTLDDVGLGYMALGQASTTLSGGEAQRVKLAAELGRASTGHTLYILDEPTTGLHFADISKLLEVLNRLVDKGNTILVIEHNPHVIKTADHVVDLGPEGGDQGGRLVAQGTPEEVAANPRSFTGAILTRYLMR